MTNKSSNLKPKEKKEKITFEEIANDWLRLHYPEKMEPIDIRWSAVYNFAKFLDKSPTVHKG